MIHCSYYNKPTIDTYVFGSGFVVMKHQNEKLQ